jgi:hypothetical protein
MIMGSALVVAGSLIRTARADAQSDAGISHSAESIHQEPSFTAGRKQVYEALTNPRLFDHAGFPKGQADHLAAGWQANYWSPMEQFLAKRPAP